MVFKDFLHSCASDVSSFGIGRVKKYHTLARPGGDIVRGTVIV